MGTPIIKHSLVKLTASPSSPSRDGSRDARGARTHGRKEARLVEIDGVARAIEVVCTCGESTLVELQFDAPPARPAAAPVNSSPSPRPSGGQAA